MTETTFKARFVKLYNDYVNANGAKKMSLKFDLINLAHYGYDNKYMTERELLRIRSL